jgi:hypothetical protein
MCGNHNGGKRRDASRLYRSYNMIKMEFTHLRNFTSVLDFGRIISTLTHKLINIENRATFF